MDQHTHKMTPFERRNESQRPLLQERQLESSHVVQAWALTITSQSSEATQSTLGLQYSFNASC